MINTILAYLYIARVMWGRIRMSIDARDYNSKVSGISLTSVIIFSALLSAFFEPFIIMVAVNEIIKLNLTWFQCALVWIVVYTLIPFDIYPRRLNQIVESKNITKGVD